MGYGFWQGMRSLVRKQVIIWFSEVESNGYESASNSILIRGRYELSASISSKRDSGVSCFNWNYIGFTFLSV